MNKVAIICAGHGGGDSGAVGQGTNEAAQAIAITNTLLDLIRVDGRFQAHVVPHELGLVASINYVNTHFKNMNDGYALEIHKNSTVNAHGVETWFYGGDADSQRMAQHIQNGLATTGLPNRGVKPDTSNRHGTLGWIRETNTWAGLAECGFISAGGDPLDPALYARGLYQGFLNLFGLPAKAAPVQPPAPKPTPAINFRVTNLDGKQIGAYSIELNAWLKYEAVQGSARIYNSAGKDITGEMVAKYRPVIVAPSPEPEQPPKTPPTPPVVEPPVRDPIHEENNAILKRLEVILNFIKSLLERVFK